MRAHTQPPLSTHESRAMDLCMRMCTLTQWGSMRASLIKAPHTQANPHDAAAYAGTHCTKRRPLLTESGRILLTAKSPMCRSSWDDNPQPARKRVEASGLNEERGASHQYIRSLFGHGQGEYHRRTHSVRRGGRRTRSDARSSLLASMIFSSTAAPMPLLMTTSDVHSSES